MMRVGDLAVRSFLDPDATLKEAAKVMLSNEASGAVAVNDKGKLEFLITEDDIVRAIARGEDPEIVKAEDYATPSPITVKPDTDVIEALRIMSFYKVAHLPVVDEEVKGLVYIRSLVYSVSDHIPIGKATLEGLSRPLPRAEGLTVAEAASEMINNETEAASTSKGLLTPRGVTRAVAEGDPYKDKAEDYADEKIIMTDEKTDILCAIQLMKNNSVDHLVVWKGRVVSVEDVGFKVPEIIREFVRYVVLVRGKTTYPGAIKTVGPYNAVIIVEGEEELARVADSVEGEVLVLVERP